VVLGFCLAMILHRSSPLYLRSVPSTMKFRVGDVVVGNDMSIRSYSHTRKGNGYGKVLSYYPTGVMKVMWYDKEGGSCSFDVSDVCFDLATKCKCRLRRLGYNKNV